MYTASVDNQGDHHYLATATGYVFSMGQGGANPVDALLASLCACVAHHVRDRLTELGIVFNVFNVKAEGELTADKSTLARISLRFALAGGAVTEAQSEDLLAQARHCPIYNTLAECAVIDLAFAPNDRSRS